MESATMRPSAGAGRGRCPTARAQEPAETNPTLPPYPSALFAVQEVREETRAEKEKALGETADLREE
jgi:hypothetical protein